MSFPAKSLHERLFSHVIKTESCWLFTASCNRKGYGQLTRYGKGTILAHRISWEIHNGPIPKGMVVLHKCDNPKCVNPAHLSLGTNAENSRDMVNKGRSHKRYKLSEADISAIITLLADGRRQKEIAALFGISQGMVSFINVRHTRGQNLSRSTHS
jgi:hypothetical protein